MPIIPITISDSQATMLQWAADQRGVTTVQLIADTLSGFLQPLETRFKTAHRDEAAKLFFGLTIEQQLEILETIRTAAGEE